MLKLSCQTGSKCTIDNCNKYHHTMLILQKSQRIKMLTAFTVQRTNRWGTWTLFRRRFLAKKALAFIRPEVRYSFIVWDGVWRNETQAANTDGFVPVNVNEAGYLQVKIQTIPDNPVPAALQMVNQIRFTPIRLLASLFRGVENCG